MRIDLRPLGVAFGMLLAWAIPAAADGCGRLTHDGQGYVVCEVSADREPALRLWQDDAKGKPLRNFNNVRTTVTGASRDNFGMLPNGVFCTGGAKPFQVIESRAFADARPDCRLATQSGPMLVIDGDLHPRFLVDSDSRHVRNGVGVSPDGQTAWFAISDRAVTFHEFGRLFRDGLGVRDALYFDGSISRLYAPGVNRADFGRSLGPIIGLVDSAG